MAHLPSTAGPRHSTARTPTSPAVTADAAVSTEGLTLRAGTRTIFEDIALEIPTGSLGVLVGASGSGKSALALALAGRLRATAGTAVVLGSSLPRHAGQVRRRAGIAGNPTVAPLDETLTVGHHVAEALRLADPWWRMSVPRDRTARTIAAANDLIDALEDVVADTGLQVPLAQARLDAGQLVRDATSTARFALGLVIALAPGPDLLMVDDVDQLRTADERRAAWAALLMVEHSHGERALTVVATCQDVQELEDVLTPSHHLGALPLRPVSVHALGVVNLTPASLPTSEIR